MSDVREGDNSTRHLLSQALSNTRIRNVLNEAFCLFVMATLILRRAVNTNLQENVNLPNEMKRTDHNLIMAIGELGIHLGVELVSRSFAATYIQFSLKRAQERGKRANGDIQTVLKLEKLSRSIANPNVLGALFEVLRFLSLANEELLDALDEEVRLRNRGQHNISEVNPSETRGLETALIEELRLALLE